MMGSIWGPMTLNMVSAPLLIKGGVGNFRQIFEGESWLKIFGKGGVAQKGRPSAMKGGLTQFQIV